MLGLDDAMSRDHDWGCRLTLLVDEDGRDQVPRMSAISSLSHKVEVATVADFTPGSAAGGLPNLGQL